MPNTPDAFDIDHAEDFPIDESAQYFDCGGSRLYGVLTRPVALAAADITQALVLVVGGPQYRAGSHRQFTLIARGLAAQGIAVLRFDYRGMGDSEGEPRDFEAVQDDLRAAVDHLCAQLPALRRLTLWGLCDAASAALFYAPHDPRVAGLVLVNPWARTSAGVAQATLRHHYLARLRDPGFWRKLAGGRFDWRASISSLWDQIRALGSGAGEGGAGAETANGAAGTTGPGASLPERLYASWRQFDGRVLLILCDADMTGLEFADLIKGSRQWRELLQSKPLELRRLPGADHTFSRAAWRRQVIEWSGAWIRDGAEIGSCAGRASDS